MLLICYIDYYILGVVLSIWKKNIWKFEKLFVIPGILTLFSFRCILKSFAVSRFFGQFATVYSAKFLELKHSRKFIPAKYEKTGSWNLLFIYNTAKVYSRENSNYPLSAKVYFREIEKFHGWAEPRKFLQAKVSSPKVCGIFCRQNHVFA